MKLKHKISIVFLTCIYAANISAQTNIFQSDGNVGIGTTNPQFPLEIIGTNNLSQLKIGPKGVISSPESVPAILDFYSTFSGNNMDQSPRRTATIKGLFSNNGNWGNETMTFQVGTVNGTPNDGFIEPQERMRIAGNGNIGIGTTNPTYNLDVSGTIRNTGNLYTKTIYSSGSDFVLGLNDGRADANGQIPVYQRALAHTNYLSPQGNELIINFEGDFAGGTYIAGPKVNIYGNLAIGSGNPSPEKLYVEDGGILVRKHRTSTNSETPLVYGTQHVDFTNGYAGIYLYEDGIGGFGQASGLSFKVSANDAASNTAMIIRQNGNVGIGTSTPQEALSVNGNIRSKEVKVEATGWPDYVFQPQYKLPKLPEIEKYINKNGHLPNIPSATEVSKSGVSLGEMNAKLLEKIEELTLLLIEQNKRILDLEKKVNQ